MSDPDRTSLKYLYLAYALVIVILAAYPLFTLKGDELYQAYDEYNWIEDVQWAHIAIALVAQVILLGWGGKRERELRLIDWMGTILLGSMLLRELNNWWEAAGVQTEYRVVGYSMLLSIIILGIVLILERRRQSIPVFSLPRQHWIRMYLLGLAGYLLANAVARWVKDMGTDRVYWRVVEEGFELLCGTLFLFGGIEAVRAALRARRD